MSIQNRTTLSLATALFSICAFGPRLHAQTQQTLSGPDGCTATAEIFGSGNFAGGSLSASCPGQHTLVVTVTISSSGGGGGSETNTCSAASTCETQANATAYGSARATYTWTVDGVAGTSTTLSE